MPGERGYAYLLGNDVNQTANLSKGDDTKMPKQSGFHKDAKHSAVKQMMSAAASGDHESFNDALEDWQALHEESGPDADYDPEDTTPT